MKAHAQCANCGCDLYRKTFWAKLANGKRICMTCGRDGVRFDRDGNVKGPPERPEFPIYYDAQGREHGEF